MLNQFLLPGIESDCQHFIFFSVALNFALFFEKLLQWPFKCRSCSATSFSEKSVPALVLQGHGREEN